MCVCIIYLSLYIYIWSSVGQPLPPNGDEWPILLLMVLPLPPCGLWW